MNMKWFASLAFIILLETSKTEGQDVRVKLCGREFIRMVVTSCGSSRLKRNAPDSDLHFANPHSRFTFFRHSCNYQFINLLCTLFSVLKHLMLIHHLFYFRESTKVVRQRSHCTPERDPDCWGQAVEGAWLPWERDRASSPPSAHKTTSRASGTLHHCAGSQHVVQDPPWCGASGRLLYFRMYHEWTDSILLRTDIELRSLPLSTSEAACGTLNYTSLNIVSKLPLW